MIMVTKRSDDAYAATAFSRDSFIPCVGARSGETSTSLTQAPERPSLKEVRTCAVLLRPINLRRVSATGGGSRPRTLHEA
jgi:hypothetical protein